MRKKQHKKLISNYFTFVNAHSTIKADMGKSTELSYRMSPRFPILEVWGLVELSEGEA